jgi:UDP-2,3-diacylglucosamine pyrophosphatase LpxH
VILAQLSDLHLRGEDDAVEFARQLDRIVARRVDHLVITGDLLDRWNPRLFERALALLRDRRLLTREAVTLIHGNHDLASSGGHPQRRSDLWRLASRFWDPPPLIAVRKRKFYRQIAAHGPELGSCPPFQKTLAAGLRLAAVDSVPSPWTPFRIRRGTVTVHHARGALAPRQTEWLSALRGAFPLVVLVHHYPLPVSPFRWQIGRSFDVQSGSWLVRRFKDWHMEVPMEIESADRQRFWNAAHAARAMLVACGHVHRARLDHEGGIAVGLNGQSGAAWAGRTIAYYRIEDRVSVEYETVQG